MLLDWGVNAEHHLGLMERCDSGGSPQHLITVRCGRCVAMACPFARAACRALDHVGCAVHGSCAHPHTGPVTPAPAPCGRQGAQGGGQRQGGG